MQNVTIESIKKEPAKSILKIEESHFCDVKAKEISPAKLTKSISAFCNTSGGEIYLGIRETRTEKKRNRRSRFQAKDPADDLYAVGLLISISTVELPDGKEQHYKGHAYILHESREGLEKAQDRLRQMGWGEIPDM